MFKHRNNPTYIKTELKINNLPDYAKRHKYIVARFDNNNELWFWGAWAADQKKEAEKAAEEISGIVIDNIEYKTTIKKEPTVFHTTIGIHPEIAETIHRYLTKEPRCPEECQSEDDTIVFTAHYPDKKEMDIKCCGVQYEKYKNNTSWTEAVLFDENGAEIACSEPCDEFLGTWELSHNGNIYQAEITVNDTASNKA